ncbi:Sensor histidine kinase YesM [Ruminococcus sp. YE71]|uniref:sensor histidine kinase n=1 Tax=unclassified Ruminococcus TaxID=2608920 RepID=UPI000888D47E|nr:MULTISPECIES: sensor histidine kinase [unclassified Ruminococcus]SDA20162.1 Sensor histidine kinase YesM [Ruminococcus sp. YE78]SFW31933.1 Sensor histidine kinase YesM [Ruminococcus sp. YE71]
METALYLISNAVHLYAVFMLFKATLGESRLPPFAERLTYILYYAVNCSVFLFTESMLLNLISNTLPMFLIMLQYHRYLRTYFFMTFALTAVGMFIDWIVHCIVPDSIFISCNTLQSIMFLGLAFIFRRVLIREDTDISSNFETFLPILCSAGTVIIAVLMGPVANLTGMSIAALLLMINFLTFYSYDKLLEKMRLKLTLSSIERINKTYHEQLEIMQGSQKQIRLLRHDMKNHLLVIESFIESGETEKACTYISRLTDSMKTDASYISTGSSELDGLLNYKRAAASEKGIDFKCGMILPADTDIDSIDLTALLGNLIDNAIEASEKVSEPQIELITEIKRGYLNIVVSNRIEGSVLGSNPKLVTSKPDKLSHGLGLRSVGQICEKYGGSAEYYEDGGRFVADILLKMKR